MNVFKEKACSTKPKERGGGPPRAVGLLQCVGKLPSCETEIVRRRRKRAKSAVFGPNPVLVKFVNRKSTIPAEGSKHLKRKHGPAAAKSERKESHCEDLKRRRSSGIRYVSTRCRRVSASVIRFFFSLSWGMSRGPQVGTTTTALLPQSRPSGRLPDAPLHRPQEAGSAPFSRIAWPARPERPIRVPVRLLRETGRRLQSLLRRASAGTVNDSLQARRAVIQHRHLSL